MSQVLSISSYNYPMTSDTLSGKDFSQWTADDARTALNLRKSAISARAIAYHEGDHWQKQKEWRGPIPQGATAINDWAEIERCFVSKNVVKEVEGRHTFGVLGREPMWAMLDSEGKKTKDADLVKWWDDRQMLLKLREAVKNLLVTGTGALRVFVSPLRAGDRLSRLHFTVCEPGQAVVYTDKLSQRQIGLYSYQDAEGNEIIEASWLLPTGKTRIRTLAEKGEPASLISRGLSFLGITPEQVVTTMDVDLGGHLHVYEMRRDPLISEQVLQNQGLLNLALTMLPRNVVLGGFLERIFLNAQRPTEKVLKSGSSTEYEEVETDLAVGAGATPFVSGLTYVDQDGNTRVANPSVVFRDPIKVETFKDTAGEAYVNILDETHQKHVVITGAGNELDELRKQARDDYEKSLLTTKGVVDPLGRFVLEIADRFRGGRGEFSGRRAMFDARIDVGPLNSEEIRMMQEEWAKGLLSRPSYMNRRGVDDPDGEIGLIDSDTALTTWEARLELAKQARELGFDVDFVLEQSGLTDAKARRKLLGAGVPPTTGEGDDANGGAELIQ